MAQWSPEHVADAWATEQLTPHAPQFDGLSTVFVSQPLSRFVSQSPQPVEQCSTQAPATHAGIACTVLHACVHDPHDDAPVVVSRHVPEQHDCPVAQPCVGLQPGTHAPAVQTVPGMHIASVMQPTHW